MAADSDLLAGVAWECASTRAAEAQGPEGLEGLPLRWLPATVPGTAAAALLGAGRPEPTSVELDAEDWWFRCRFAAPGAAGHPSRWLLELEGLATVADVWLNGEHLARSEGMFTPQRLRIEHLGADNSLAIRFSALAPMLVGRRPRPRWKTAGATHQNLRWFRTTLLGRQAGWTVTPAPVGPWRPVGLFPEADHRVVRRRLGAQLRSEGSGQRVGTVTVDLQCTTGHGLDGEELGSANLEVAGRRAPLRVRRSGPYLSIIGSVDIPGVEEWWPHTHGPQPLYPVAVEVGGDRIELGQVGFRTVSVDTTGGGFELAVNGSPVFCRGACWYPIDPVSFGASVDELRRTLLLVRDAGMNLLRVPGGTVYESQQFWSLCDELGILVWQDAMLAFLDPPDDDAFVDAISEELTEVLSGLSGHPSLAVVCGGQELEEQPAMFGLTRDKWSSTVTTTVVPELVEQLIGDVPYLTSSPTGGVLPFQIDEGVSHYTGVGVFLRPLSDLRRAAPRFVSEGLAFAIPPAPETVDEVCGGARQAGHDPVWKRAIHHDTGGSWDLEDVRDHYVRLLFGEDPVLVRRADPERGLELGRAAVAHVMAEAVAEWRRPGSPCAGLVLVGLRDLRPGAGWGVIDALGRPKAPWFTLARACRPTAVLVTDEGLNGLGVHLVNDTPASVAGSLLIGLHTGEHCAEAAECAVEIPARAGITLSADSLFDGFRDLTYAYRFGPRSYELVTAELRDEDGALIAGAGYLPGGLRRDVQSEIGLQAALQLTDKGIWQLSVSTRRFAQFVSIDVPGFRPDDSWFHLAPGATVVTCLRPDDRDTVPRGSVRALNSAHVARVSP